MMTRPAILLCRRTDAKQSPRQRHATVDRGCALFWRVGCSNFGRGGYGGGDGACHPMTPTIVFFVRGDLPLHSFRAKVAAVAALVLAFTLTAGQAQPAGKLAITVSGLRNSDGVVRCALFNSPAAFPKIGQEWRGVIAPIRGSAANCVFTGVPAGTYAMSRS